VLPAWPLPTAFFIASLILAITPGPGVFYIVTRSLTQGRQSGLTSVAGVALGNFGNAIAAAIGLGAVFAIYSAAFMIVKYAGALYLIYLGVQALRTRSPDGKRSIPEPMQLSRVFCGSFVVALLNPKTAIFFAAFLPQFLDAGTSPVGQSIMLGSFFVAIAAATDSMYAAAAGAIAPVLVRTRHVRAFGRYLTGGAFIGLGLFSAISGPRSAK
jgi:threonine/homoserine/homoserine lactone efflux protein